MTNNIEGAALPALAAKLDHLFKTVHPSSKDEYSYEQVAKELARRDGPTVSATYLWQLRKVLRDNPTMRHLEALSDFFGVPAAYFFDDDTAKRIDAELDLLTTMRDSGVRHVALRSAGLSAGSLEVVRAMIEQARKLEGLNDRDE